jgi:type III pantothenate kinase
LNLIIDIGNTATKIAIFDGVKIIQESTNQIELVTQKIESLVENYHITNCIISSVISDIDSVSAACKEQFHTIVLSPQIPIPISNQYSTPETLGNDRLACVVAASAAYKNQNTLCIDLGTCIKYDFIDQQNKYQGGAISPGMHMRFKALNTFTSQLPLVQPGKLTDNIGKSTETSILSGVQNGITSEINSVTSQYRTQFNPLNVIITGGDHKYFEKGLKNITFADPYLVLRGLNEILEYNTKN